MSFLAQLPADAHADWLRINAVEAVSRCMERASLFAEAQEWGCAAFWNFALVGSQVPRLLESGVLDTLNACLSHAQHQRHLGMQVRSMAGANTASKPKVNRVYPIILGTSLWYSSRAIRPGRRASGSCPSSGDAHCA